MLGASKAPGIFVVAGRENWYLCKRGRWAIICLYLPPTQGDDYEFRSDCC